VNDDEYPAVNDEYALYHANDACCGEFVPGDLRHAADGSAVDW
jgi:hypothetical protein